MHHINIVGVIIGSVVGVTWFFILPTIAAIIAWAITVYFISKKFIEVSTIEIEEEEERFI